VVVSNDRDHSSCQGGSFLWQVYLSVKQPNICYAFPDLPKMTARLAKSLNASSLSSDDDDIYLTVAVSDAGISFTIYADAHCTTQTRVVPNLPFGGCIQYPGYSYSVTVDATQYLPAPMPGHVLYKRWVKSPHCAGEPVYFMMPTSCLSAGEDEADLEIVCGESVSERYSTFSLLVYGQSHGATCTGSAQTLISKVGLTSCSSFGGDEGMEAVWCGAGCRVWKTLRSRYPKCDAPGAGTIYAVDLAKVLGPECSSNEAQVGPGQCCYEPLGYDGGLSFGTDCRRACNRHQRHGSPQEWCQKSDGTHFGNCFCGPANVVRAPGAVVEDMT